MTGDEDTMRGKVIASIPLMIRGVPKEDTTSRVRCKLVRCSGREVRVASAPKDSKVIIGGRGAKESEVRCGSANRLGGRRLSR
jgi:hypothetical protein